MMIYSYEKLVCDYGYSSGHRVDIHTNYDG